MTSAFVNAQGPVDLSENGIPVTVSAPENWVLEEGVGNGMVFDEVISHVWEVVNSDADFALEVAMDDESMWQSAEEYVASAREFAEMSEEFVEFVESNSNGFIAKFDYEGEIEYSFYHLLVKNDHAIEFSPGLGIYNYSLENIRKHYEVAKGAN
jgi:hypothetical protein